jgi:hypothetical protein
MDVLGQNMECAQMSRHGMCTDERCIPGSLDGFSDIRLKLDQLQHGLCGSKYASIRR